MWAGACFILDPSCDPAFVNYMDCDLCGQWAVQASVLPSDFTPGVSGV